MKKISFLITHNKNGGAQDAIIKISNLVSNEFIVEVICIYGGGVDCDTRIKPLSITNSSNKYFKAISGVINYYKYILNSKPDVVFSFLPFANVVNGIFSVCLKYKSIISHRNPVFTYSPIMRFADKVIGFYPGYDLVTCNSMAVAKSLDRYTKHTKQKIRIINNYVVPLESYSDRSSLESSLGIKLAERFCLAVGRLTNQKRFDVIVEALRGTSIQLLIAGDGPLLEVLKERATDNIVFLGHLDEIHVKSLLYHCHVYLQPSAYEGQSNSLLEAILHSCIIISSDIPPQREVLSYENSDAGILLNTYEPSAWFFAISDALKFDNNPYIETIKNIRLIYSKSKVKKSLSKIFEEINENK